MFEEGLGYLGFEKNFESLKPDLFVVRIMQCNSVCLEKRRSMGGYWLGSAHHTLSHRIALLRPFTLR